MLVSSVENFKLSFGYNKKLHEELKEKIANCKDAKWANTIEEMDRFCIATENKLRDAQNSADKDKEIEKYKGIFLRAKEALANMVTATFPELKYADREQKTYWREAKQKDCDWLKSAARILDTYTVVSQIEKPKEIITRESALAASKAAQSKPQNSNTQPTMKVSDKQSEASQLVEEFHPSLYSPDGFKDVVGMDELKQSLVVDVIEPINNPEQAKQDFIDYEKEFPKGVLMFGPPGCGKTYITQALAREVDTTMYKLTIGKAGSSYINATAQNIKKAFDYVGSIGHKSEKPILLFMDEIDSLGFDRSTRTDNEDIKQVATLLQSIDDIRSKNVILIGATNKPNLIDPAVKRRFDQKEYVGLPDDKVRLSLVQTSLKRKAKGAKLLEDEEALDNIVSLTKGYSNSAICNINKQAALNALSRGRCDIELQDYIKAIDECEEEKYNEDDYRTEQGRKKNSNPIGFSAS